MAEFGLTGGIGSGKSTVADALVRRGAVLVDADRIVRELQEPGSPVFDAMVERWGPEIVASDGTLDRAAVAARVFDDPGELAALNAIVHPAVGAEMRRRRAELAGTGAIVVLDIPLLVRSDDEPLRDEYRALTGIVVVDVDPELALERLVRYRGFDPADARARIERQASREARLAVADFVVDNSGDLEHLEREVDRCWRWMRERAARPGDGPAVGTGGY